MYTINRKLRFICGVNNISQVRHTSICTCLRRRLLCIKLYSPVAYSVSPKIPVSKTGQSGSGAMPEQIASRGVVWRLQTRGSDRVLCWGKLTLLDLPLPTIPQQSHSSIRQSRPQANHLSCQVRACPTSPKYSSPIARLQPNETSRPRNPSHLG